MTVQLADLPDYTVIEIKLTAHPFLDAEVDGQLVPLKLDKRETEILVKLPGWEADHVKVPATWTPPGCETWDVTSEKLQGRGTVKVLALGGLHQYVGDPIETSHRGLRKGIGRYIAVRIPEAIVNQCRRVS